eukprot:TRINITY_DN4232_c0_g1_i5.p1 TRINITY_DN4232_c0_g1~~TRINITY_DN4232_c0_g1_i5.p1  ORF type:complete len:830 (-),score=119.10 TRINITY_DN4232_c0_g1_i5:1802-4291(-)
MPSLWVVLCLLVLTSFHTSVQGTFVSPSGSGTFCNLTHPCALDVALDQLCKSSNATSFSGEVLLLPGTYNVTRPMASNSHLSLKLSGGDNVTILGLSFEGAFFDISIINITLSGVQWSPTHFQKGELCPNIGGCYSHVLSDITLFGVSMNGTTSPLEGGWVFMAFGDIVVERSVFQRLRLSDSGGGLFSSNNLNISETFFSKISIDCRTKACADSILFNSTIADIRNSEFNLVKQVSNSYNYFSSGHVDVVNVTAHDTDFLLPLNTILSHNFNSANFFSSTVVGTHLTFLDSFMNDVHLQTNAVLSLVNSEVHKGSAVCDKCVVNLTNTNIYDLPDLDTTYVTSSILLMYNVSLFNSKCFSFCDTDTIVATDVTVQNVTSSDLFGVGQLNSGNLVIRDSTLESLVVSVIAYLENITISNTNIGILVYPRHKTRHLAIEGLFVVNSVIMHNSDWNPGFEQSWLPLTDERDVVNHVVFRNVSSSKEARSVFLIEADVSVSNIYLYDSFLPASWLFNGNKSLSASNTTIVKCEIGTVFEVTELRLNNTLIRDSTTTNSIIDTHYLALENITVTGCFSGTSTISMDSINGTITGNSAFFNNTAMYGAFIAYSLNASTYFGNLILDDTVIQHNTALVAGGKYFCFEPYCQYLGCSSKDSGNSAHAYGDEVAGTISHLELFYPKYIYPGQIFEISAVRKDFCNQTITSSVTVTSAGSTILSNQYGSVLGISDYVNGVTLFGNISVSFYDNVTFIVQDMHSSVEAQTELIEVSWACPPGFSLVFFFLILSYFYFVFIDFLRSISSVPSAIPQIILSEVIASHVLMIMNASVFMKTK